MYSQHFEGSKITATQQQRLAYVYVRQSTVFQTVHHRESTERQYNLGQRAESLGWSTEAIIVIDEDQGQSAVSANHRHGFQRLVAAVAAGEVGLVLMLEASRLSRCGSDWHRLIELCSLTQTLIADEQSVYDPRQPNDRLLLGVKGTLSEAELMTLRTRLFEGRWNKAQRGQLGRPLPIGYVYDAEGHWVKDPDLQIQDRLTYLFDLFHHQGVARQVLVSLKAEQLKLPIRVWGGPCHGQLQWKKPTYSMVIRRLHNPAYAGAYVYGEMAFNGNERSPKTGKARARVRSMEDWPVCIQDHHEGYIGWEEYLSNQHQLKQNCYFSTTQGAVRKGAALLQGLVWCGYCGAKMGVNSHAARDHRHPSYICSHAYSEGAAKTCQSMTSKPIDDLIVSLFLEALAPSQIKIALQAGEQLQQERQALQHQWEQQLQQARYEVKFSQRQYDAVDPDNRLVASELERRWNDKLEALQTLENAYSKAQQESRFTINDQEKQAMENLAQDLPAVWYAGTTTDAERKQLLRYAIKEVQLDGVTEPGKINIRVAWYSGAVTERQIDRIKVGIWAPRTNEKVIDRIRDLASTHTVDEIVECLNQEGWRSAHGKTFRDYHVLYIARRNQITVTSCTKRLLSG